MKTTGLVLLPAFALLAGAGAPGDDPTWMSWSGPLGTGYAPDSNPPMTWSETSNVRWKTEIPGSGHASPVVFGDRIFVLTAVKTGEAEPTAEPLSRPGST